MGGLSICLKSCASAFGRKNFALNNGLVHVITFRMMISAHGAPPAWVRQTRHVSQADVRFLFDEIHFKRAYMQHGLLLRPGQSVIDIGANIGMLATLAAQEVGETGRVIAVEPLPPTFAALQHNIGLHNVWCAQHGIPFAAVTLLNCGVSDGSADAADFTLYPRAAGWATLSRYRANDAVLADMDAFLDNALRDGSSALNAPTRIAGQVLRTVSPPLYRAVARAAVQRMLGDTQTFTCPLTTVSEIIDSQRLERVHVLKVDVERAELEVLRGVRQCHWPRIEQAALEVHAESLPAALDLLRGAAGFDVVVEEQSGDMRGTSIHMVFCRRE